MTAKKKTIGRPLVKDRREVLPFRLKGSLVKKCRGKGRDWLESLIRRAK